MYKYFAFQIVEINKCLFFQFDHRGLKFTYHYGAIFDIRNLDSIACYFICDRVVIDVHV